MFSVKTRVSLISGLLIADHTAKVIEPLSAKINDTQTSMATLTESVDDCQRMLLDLSQKREEANRRKAELRVQQGQTNRSTRHDIGTSSPPDEPANEEDDPAASVGSGHDAITDDPNRNKVLVQRLFLRNAELKVTQQSAKQKQMEAKKEEQQKNANEKKRKAAQNEQRRQEKLERKLEESKQKKQKLDAELSSASSAPR